MMHFTLYSRSYCHLCDDMLEQLQSYSADYAFTVEVLDVDADDALLALYDESVPVLMGKKDGQAEQRICHYFLDTAALKAFFHA
ncbi:MAG: glutaredoxin family protein [Burkholderiales bacterium]|nr:glutaredoxin family protein [Burkholderiales bacterium]